MWSDNVLIRMLSNFHVMGVLQKKRDGKGKREGMKSEVPCPAQTKDYCAIFHLINKENGAEVNYDLGGRAVCTIGRQS